MQYQNMFTVFLAKKVTKEHVDMLMIRKFDTLYTVIISLFICSLYKLCFYFKHDTVIGLF